MTERNARIAALVDQLKVLLEPYDCAGLSTDYQVSNETGANRRCIVPERHGAGKRYALLSSRENIRPKACRALDNFLGCGLETANQVLDVALELSELNDIGSWPFETDKRPTKVMTARGCGARLYPQLPGIENSYLILQNAMPQIERIVLHANTGLRKGGKSLKGWMHFYDAAGDQVCAISTNLLATSVRAWFGDSPEERATADRHLGRWAHQINADLADFIEAAMHLIKLDTYLFVTEISLRHT